MGNYDYVCRYLQHNRINFLPSAIFSNLKNLELLWVYSHWHFCQANSGILMVYGQPLFVWLSCDWPSVRTYLRTYASTDCKGRVGETIKRREGCLRRVLESPHLVYWTFTIWSVDSCYKRLVYTHPDFLARFWKVKSWTQKIWPVFFPGLVNLLWSRAIMALKCDRRCLLFWACTYGAILGYLQIIIFL